MCSCRRCFGLTIFPFWPRTEFRTREIEEGGNLEYSTLDDVSLEIDMKHPNPEREHLRERKQRLQQDQEQGQDQDQEQAQEQDQERNERQQHEHEHSWRQQGPDPVEKTSPESIGDKGPAMSPLRRRSETDELAENYKKI